jgi:hypothetical protein
MPKPAKLAGFFQGHFIRFWNRGQAGNGVCELFGRLGGARLPKCLSELDKLYDVRKHAGNNAEWAPSRWDGAGMSSGQILRNRWEYLYGKRGAPSTNGSARHWLRSNRGP